MMKIWRFKNDGVFLMIP